MPGSAGLDSALRTAIAGDLKTILADPNLSKPPAPVDPTTGEGGGISSGSVLEASGRQYRQLGIGGWRLWGSDG